MKKIGIILFAVISLTVAGQDTLYYENALLLAGENAPRLRDLALIDEQGRLTERSIETSWYPVLTVNGKVSYQSDVVSLEIDDPAIPFSFPEMPNEQFGLNLDVKQTIYDGGLAKRKKEFEALNVAADRKQAEVDLYSFKGQVSDIYFMLLTLDERKKVMDIAMGNLKAREKVVSSAIENGIAEENELRVLQVEILKTLQSISEIRSARNGFLRMLSVYTGMKLMEETVIKAPYIEFIPDEELSRPEVQWFEIRSDALEAGKGLATVKRLPRLFAYGQAGVGMPGYNMLNDEVDGYFMIGAGLQWNIWDWNNVKREKQILERKQQVLMNARETFVMNVKASMEKEVEDMEHLRNALELDDKIVEMRMSITGNAASKMDNGIISATDYLQILNEEKRARVVRSDHQVQLLRTLAKYNMLNGTL